MVILVCGAAPDDITKALTEALLTDDELRRPQQWSSYPDPFGEWHNDPCDELPGGVTETAALLKREGDET